MSIPSAMASSANTPARVPPGFRFHPTDEELVDYYLKKKVESQRIDLDVIREIDLYKIEPWDLQERCRIGSTDQDEWYFFSHKDKKYPTGTRTNRATTAGFWKATGRDKAIYSKHKLVGMRKTLVFYKGRAPNGQKTDWIMHEYRLENCENPSCSVNAMPQPAEEGWAVCRVFKKRSPNIKALLHDRDPMMGGFCFEEQMCNFFGEGLESPRATTHVNSAAIANMMMATPKFLHQQQQISGSGLHYHHLNLGHRHHPEPIHGAGQDDLLVPYPFGSFNRNSLHDHHGSALQGVGTIGASIFACKQELDQLPDYQMPAQDSFMRLPQLESPKFSTAVPPAFSLRPVGGPPPKPMHDRSLLPFDNDLGAFMQHQRSGVLSPSQTSTTTCTNVCSLSDDDINKEGSIAAVPAVNNQAESITDWRVLDRLVASQLSQDIPVEKSPCARLSMASPFDAQYGCNSMANADPDQQCATPSDGSDKQPSSTPSSSMSQPASSNYNPSNDIDLWSFAKRDLVSDHI